ncbi:MAG: aldose 1-epimerase family protein, partial [Clostridia bacterium]|nr:aldose 1-epimerase family protein [Clostridia bacterium]
MVILKNERLEVSIAEHGAEIRRLLLDGKDVLWSGDPAVWSGVAPLLFPICGGLKDDKYTLCGREYTLEKHGFARHSHFAVESRGVNRVTFLLTDDDETYAKYPFHFELRVTYSLRGTAVEVTYQVTNRSEGTMYYSIGSHEAYACIDGDIEDYDVIFPQNETLNAYTTEGTLLSGKTVPI